MKPFKRKMLLILMATAVTIGCATQRPALYPNERYRSVGREVAEADLDQCLQLATDHGVTSNTKKVAAETATNATVGAASGAAVGAIYDNAGHGAAAGAVGATVSGVMRRVLQPRPPDMSYRDFVERCLRDKGYEPMSWQ